VSCAARSVVLCRAQRSAVPRAALCGFPVRSSDGRAARRLMLRRAQSPGVWVDMS
ncbi:hypothetical protein A2U01_0061679, partial [Trifolium medium]|nr:hypothetical protein [Trifolium medium]